MMYRATTGDHKDELHTVAEWHLIIREVTDRTAKGTHVAVWKKGVAEGVYVRETGKQTNARKHTAKKKMRFVLQRKTSDENAHVVKVQVTDDNDERLWDFVKETFDTEAERDIRIAEILADKDNCDYRSSGWDADKFTVSYWKVRE